MPDLLIDALNQIAKHEARAADVMDRLYEFIQQVEAEKTPGASRPFTMNLLCPSTEAMPLLPHNDNRQVVGILNEGPDTLWYSNAHFHPGSILQQMSSYNNHIDLGVIPAGGNAALYSTEGIWVYNYAVAPGGCILSVLETIYATRKFTKGAYGRDGLVHAGYNGLGQKELR